MKILIIGPYGEGFLPFSYARALETNGNQAIWFDDLHEYFHSVFYRENFLLRRLLRHKLWQSLNVKLLAMVRESRPEMLLAFKAAFLHPSTIRVIRNQEGIPIVNYYPDNPYCGVPFARNKTSAQRRDIIECLREYTLVCTWSRQLAERLERDGVHSSYLPFGVDRFSYNPASGEVDERFRKHHGIVFVGLRSKKRDQHLGRVDRHPISIWGPGWEKASRRVKSLHEIRPDRTVGRNCASLYANADIALNIVDDLNMPGHNMRTFEIPASGGVMVSTYTKEQDEFFPEGEAAFYYRDPSELDDMIDRLLEDGDLCAKIRSNALRLAGEHRYEVKAKELLRILGHKT